MPNYPNGAKSVSGEGGPARQAPDDTAALGRRLRALRKSAGLTLEQASKASGISRAAISRIERGEMSPTYDSLVKLAMGFGIDLAALLSDRAQTGGGVAVTRAGAGAAHATAAYSHRLLAPEFAERALYVFETEVRATSLDDYGAWDRHDSEDCLYVLSGSVVVHLEGRAPVELSSGDCLQMDGRIPHALVTVEGAGERARLLWVTVPSRS